jgi:type IV pilus assembly protein PilC
VFCAQLALILRAGLPLHDGIEALTDPYQKTRHAQGLEALREKVVETGSLYAGLKHAGTFPAYLVEMAGIGEKTGELQAVMERLAAYYEREAKVRRAIQNAVTYPLLLIVMMAVLIAVLIAEVLPVLESVMRNMGIDLAASSGVWLDMGMGLGKGILVAGGVLILIAFVVILLIKRGGNSPVKRWVFRMIRPLKRLDNKLYAGRFAANMGMMLSSGYPLDESLELMDKIIGDAEIRARVSECRERMREGLSFPDAIERIGIYQKLHCRMIKVGFQAGQTDRVMNKLAAIYEEEMDDAVQRLVSIIEPSLVALMSVIIGAILLSVMLPLLSVMGGMV